MNNEDYDMRRYPPNDVPAFAFWLMPDEDPQFEEWPLSSLIHAWQRGRCAMCQVGDWFDNGLVMDHDHNTGLIRGLLCRGCNTSESRNFSPKFVAWRDGFNVASVLGIVEEYNYLFPGQREIERKMAQPLSDAELDLIAEAVTR
jgi:hypothetical protein